MREELPVALMVMLPLLDPKHNGLFGLTDDITGPARSIMFAELKVVHPLASMTTIPYIPDARLINENPV